MKRAQGIIIQKVSYREADRIYTLYTKDFGKIKILAKGIRKMNAKLRSPLELFNHIDFYFVQGKNFKIITGSELIDKFDFIKKDFGRLEAGYRVLQLLDDSIKGEEKDERIWNLLLEILTNLNNPQYKNTEVAGLILRYFELKLLNFLGFSPQLYQCVYCGTKIAPERIFFSAKGGGLVCKNCLRDKSEIFEITPSLVKILRVILENNWDYVRKLKIAKIEEDNLQKIIQYFWEYVVE